MAASRATRSKPIVTPILGLWPAPIAVTAQTAAKLPHIQTSEWAKLIRRRTP
jgi:hypothetical protein